MDTSRDKLVVPNPAVLASKTVHAPPTSPADSADSADSVTPSNTAVESESVSNAAMLSPSVKGLLMLYEVAWLVGWVMLLFSHRFYLYHLYAANVEFVAPLWVGEAGIFGSLGGIAYAIHGIYSGRVARDKGPDRAIWYLVKPIHGALMGAVCGLLSRVVLSISGSTGIGQHILIGGIGFVTGMYERLALDIIRTFSDKRFGGKS